MRESAFYAFLYERGRDLQTRDDPPPARSLPTQPWTMWSVVNFSVMQMHSTNDGVCRPKERGGNKKRHNQWSALLHPKAECPLKCRIIYLEYSQADKLTSECITANPCHIFPWEPSIQPLCKAMYKKHPPKEPSTLDTHISAGNDLIGMLLVVLDPWKK